MTTSTTALSWVCEPCREADHTSCRGRTWCVCQHRVPGPPEPVTGPPGE